MTTRLTTDSYRKCAKCGLSSVQDNSVSFHRFPKPGLQASILKATAWATYCWPEQDWSSVEALTAVNRRNKILCGRHFEDYCFTDSSKRHLNKYSVPGTREYVIKTMQILRAKIFKSSNNSNSSGTPATGCSIQPDTIVGRTEYIEITFDVPVHRFPNPEKHPDLFTSWVTVIGKKLEESDPKAVYKNKRVCDHHFDPIYKISGSRLKPTTIPSVNLYGMQRSSKTFTDIDHSYSRPQRESFQPKPTRFNAGVLHVFPNPNKFPDRFRAWVTLVGGRLESSSDYEIYRKKGRVCDIHFTDEHRNRFKRLNALAIPTLHLSGIPDSCKSEASHGSRPDAPVAACSGQSYDFVPAPVVTDTPGTWHFDEVAIKNITTAASYVLAEHTYSVMSRAKMTTSNEGMLNHMNFRESFQNDHSYDRKVTIITPARGASSKKVVFKVDEKTSSTKETHQDSGTADAIPSAKDAEDIVKKEETTEEPSVIDDDFVPPSPVPEVEGSETVFSWQQSELIPADDVVGPLTADELEEQTGISLYCDDTPAPQTVPQVPKTSIKEVEYRCKDCGEIIDGFQFWCVQCFGCALCGACEARGEHKRHYVLRAPPHRAYRQTQVVLATIRHQLQNENLLSQLGPGDDGVKLEVKEEPPEEDGIVNTETHDDPLDAGDPLRHEPAPDESNHTTVAEEIAERPFKRPRFADYIERNFTTQAKVTLPKPHENVPINSDHVADQVEYVMEELENAKPKPHENIRISSDHVADQVEYVMEEVENARTKPHENIRISSDHVTDQVEYIMEEVENARTKPHENIRISSDHVADQVEYIMEEVENARTKPHENIRISSDHVADQVEYIMEEVENARTKPHENIRISSDHVADQVEYIMEEVENARTKPHENIHINSDDVDDQVEYLVEELETDDDTRDDEFTEIEHLDDEIDSVDSSILVDDVIDFRMINETDVTRIVNETFVDNRIVGAESFLNDSPRRGMRRNIIEYNRKLPKRGSPESMVRSLSSEAAVELRPLSSVEIRKWTADSKIRRK